MLKFLADAKTSGGQQPINTTTTDISVDITVLFAVFAVILLLIVVVIICVVFSRKSNNNENDTAQSLQTTHTDSVETLSPEERELIRSHRNESLILSEEEKELIRKYREQKKQ